MMPHRAVCQHRPRSIQPLVPHIGRGFTLLEVLIAVALTSSLLIAIYAALNLFWQTQRTGREEMERSQIARAVLSMMSRDIRSVVFVIPEPAEEDDSAGSEDTDGETDETTEEDTTAPVVESASDAVAAPELALYGDATSLVLQISRPARGMNYVSPGTGASITGRSSDLLKVSYFLADPSGSGLGAVVSTASGSTLEPVQGLARLEGDKFVVDLADSQGDQDALAELTRVLAPEINSLQFTYYDGGEAYESWDSSLYGKLPSAIEIVIGFRTRDELSQLEKLSGYGAVPVATYRLVVALPLSQPYIVQEEI